jgi:hypothetical protein
VVSGGSRPLWPAKTVDVMPAMQNKLTNAGSRVMDVASTAVSRITKLDYWEFSKAVRDEHGELLTEDEYGTITTCDGETVIVTIDSSTVTKQDLKTLEIFAAENLQDRYEVSFKPN